MPIMLTRKTSPARFGMVAAVMGKGGGHKRVAKKGLKRAHIERRLASGLELDTSDLGTSSTGSTNPLGPIRNSFTPDGCPL